MPPIINDPALFYPSDNHLPAIASLRQGRRADAAFQMHPEEPVLADNVRQQPDIHS